MHRTEGHVCEAVTDHRGDTTAPYLVLLLYPWVLAGATSRLSLRLF
jgi:hypothetical protein